MAIKHINEHFFDEESEVTNYILGAFYASGYIGKKKQRRGGVIKIYEHIIFRSSHSDLVEIVRRELESEHVITPDSRKNKRSFWIEVRDVTYLCDKLREMGLGVPKEERTFPRDIDKKYMSHFVRGFLDAQGIVYNAHHGKYTNIVVGFNREFLLGLHYTLKTYAGIERDEPPEDRIRYAHKDSLKIYDFIYSDWDFIKQHGLYLPSKKELYTLNYPGDWSKHPAKVVATQRIKDSKRFLLLKIPGSTVGAMFGYSHPSAFYRAFKRETGLTPTEFVKARGIL